MSFRDLWEDFSRICKRWPRLTLWFATGLIAAFLLQFSSGCSSGPQIKTVTRCTLPEQFLLPTAEPPANNGTEGQKDATHIALQGALAACNIDKKSIRDAVREINSKGDAK